MKKQMKKILLLAFVVVMAVVCLVFSASARYSDKDWEGMDLDFACIYSDKTCYIESVNPSISGNVEIPSNVDGCSVTEIEEGAFENCTGITSITIPDTMVSISEGAFSGCTGLKSITIPKSVKIIGARAFEYCTSLKSISIPDSVTFIGGDAFRNTMYYNIASNWKNDVLYIGNHLIEAKKSIISCNIRQGTKTIAGGAINSESYGRGAFSECIYLKSVKIPDSLISIGGEAFRGCESLTSITIPKSVKKIYNSAFMSCTSLTSVTLPNGIKEIADSTFLGCTSLKNITIPKSVQSIYHDAFAECTSLKSIRIPGGVKEIHTGTFDNCTSLTNIIIPKSVQHIDGASSHHRAAFEGCSNLKTVYYEGTKEQWKKIEIDGGDAIFINAAIKYNVSTTLPGKTSSLKATPTQNSVKLTWKAVSGAAGYRVYQYDFKKGASDRLATITGTSYTVKNLKSGTKYRFSVKAYRKIGDEYLWSDDYTIVVTSTAPGVTSKLSVSGQTTSSVSIKWNKVAGATGYRVYRMKKGEWVKIAETTKLTYIDKKLNSGSTYKYAVKAYVKQSKEVIWATKYKQIETSTKPATSTLKVTSTAKGKAVLNWSNPSGESGFEIYCSTKKDSGFKKIATAKANAKKATISKLRSKKTYYFKVRSYKKTASGKAYSAYSAVKSVKVK